MLCHNVQGGGQTQEYGGRFPKRQLVSYFFFSLTGAPRKRTKSLPEARWGGLAAVQRRQGRPRGACGARDGSGLVIMGPRHATGGHMCRGPGRPRGVKSAHTRPPEPRMPLPQRHPPRAWRPIERLGDRLPQREGRKRKKKELTRNICVYQVSTRNADNAH